MLGMGNVLDLDGAANILPEIALKSHSKGVDNFDTTKTPSSDESYGAR